MEEEPVTSLKLDQYVETVMARLNTLPEAERQQQVMELRQHLGELVQARSELGHCHEQASAAAIEQFGQASAVGRQLLYAYRRRRLARFGHGWPGAILLTIGSFLIVMLSSSLVLEPLTHHLQAFVDSRTFLWLGFLRISICLLLIGWVAGRLSGSKCLPVLAAYGLWFYAMYLAPQLRHEDMSDAIRSHTLTSGLLFSIAPFFAASVVLWRTKARQAI